MSVRRKEKLFLYSLLFLAILGNGICMEEDVVGPNPSLQVLVLPDRGLDALEEDGMTQSRTATAPQPIPADVHSTGGSSAPGTGSFDRPSRRTSSGASGLSDRAHRGGIAVRKRPRSPADEFPGDPFDSMLTHGGMGNATHSGGDLLRHPTGWWVPLGRTEVQSPVAFSGPTDTIPTLNDILSSLESSTRTTGKTITLGEWFSLRSSTKRSSVPGQKTS